MGHRFSSVVIDLRHGLRILRTSPGFVAVASCALALGIGLNTAIFSIVYAMLFRPLPVHDPGSLVSIYLTTAKQRDRAFPLTSRTVDFIKQESGVFSDVAMRHGVRYAMRASRGTEMVNAEWVTSNYFNVLGVAPILGRALGAEEDDLANPARAVVISHALWLRFDNDPAIIGREVVLTLWGAPDATFVIVGIMPPGFNGISEPWEPTHVWTTFVQGRTVDDRRRARFTGVGLARLKPGVDVRQAQATLGAQSRQATERQFAQDTDPRLLVRETGGITVPDDPSAAAVPVRLAGAMMLVVAMVLLVAATNIAGILTARALGRAGEIAIRRALGASPVRIARQLMAETLALASIGGLLGLLIAAWLVDLFRVMTPLHYALDVAIVPATAIFAAALCVVTAIVAGIMPARQTMGMDVLPWLAGTGGTQTRGPARPLRHAITLPQVAISLALLLVAGVYVRGILKIELSDPGYRTARVAVLDPMLRLQPGERTNTDSGLTDEQYAERTRRFYRQLLQRLQTTPGGLDAAIVSGLPVREPRQRSTAVVTQDAYVAGERAGLAVESAAVSPNYFRTMGIRLVAGRDFDERDGRTTPGVVVVSAATARRLWPGRDGIGQTLTVLDTSRQAGRVDWYEVVGVVSDVRGVLQEREEREFVYFAMGQEWRPDAAHVVVSGADAGATVSAVSNAIRGADPLADVRQVQTLEQMVDGILYPRRVVAAILAVSGTIALLLSAIGIYGVVSYSVVQRVGEIGLRMALGADRTAIVRLVLREAGTVLVAGSVAGLALGYAAIQITSHRYLPLPEVDVVTLLLAPSVLGAAVLLASWLPARRAARVDPMDVLRRA